MVSTVKYYGFKDIELFRRKPFRWLVIAILLIIVVAYQPELTLFGLTLLYVASGPVLTVVLMRQHRKARKLHPERFAPAALPEEKEEME